MTFPKATITWSSIIRKFQADLCYAPALNTKTILIDSEGTTIQQQWPRVWLDCTQVDGHDERWCHYTPQRHLCPLLVITQPIVTDYQLNNDNTHATRGCGRWGAARYGAVHAVEYGQTEGTGVAMATRAPGARDPYTTCQISSWSDNRRRSYRDFLQTTQLAAMTLTFDPLTLKLVHGVLVSQWPFLPSLAFLGLFVFPRSGGTGQTNNAINRRDLDLWPWNWSTGCSCPKDPSYQVWSF